MILYYDNLITNEPLHKTKVQWGIDSIRESVSIYRKHDKLDVSLYTLESYAIVPWSAVIIKYELEDKSKNDMFEKRVKEIFKNPIIIRGRSDNQEKFKESISLLKSIPDEWIFYAGNNDNPIIASEIESFFRCLEAAKALKKDHQFVSIVYSQCDAFRSFADPRSYYNRYYYKNLVRILSETEDYTVVKYALGEFSATQVVHKDLFEHWFCSKKLPGLKIVRSDSPAIEYNVEVKNQIVIIPKKDFCAHYDGNSNLTDDGILTSEGYADPNDLLPPLFIPIGYFNRDIKIAYGYEEYREGWVNINPVKKDYSFRDSKNGTDLKISLETIPLFWKGKISRIDVNPELDKEKIKEALAVIRKKCEVLYPVSSMSYISQIRMRIKWLLKVFKKYYNDPEILVITRKRGGFLIRSLKSTLYILLKIFKK